MRLKGFAAVAAVATMLALAGAALATGGLSGKYGRTVKGAGNLNGPWVLDFAAHGRYTVAVGGHVIGRGTLVVSGNKATFRDSGCKLSQRGRYTFALEGKTLTFRRISDACVGRRTVLAKPLRRIE